MVEEEASGVRRGDTIEAACCNARVAACTGEVMTMTEDAELCMERAAAGVFRAGEVSAGSEVAVEGVVVPGLVVREVGGLIIRRGVGMG